MPAWKATKKWTNEYIEGYRLYVSTAAPFKRGAGPEDCADLSMSLLIDYAESFGLPLTFKNEDGWVYISEGEDAIKVGRTSLTPRNFFDPRADYAGKASWKNKDEFKQAIWEHMNVRDLWNHNTRLTNLGRPSPGDLMMRYGNGHHHCALVYRVFPPRQSHPEEKNKTIPDFPGDSQAKKEAGVTRYFLGETYEVEDETVTLTRRPAPASGWHFDYLNSRSDVKRHAELILFANYTDFQREGFEFRIYNEDVFR